MGLTQDEFGFRIGVAKQTLSGWEHGRSLPDIITLCDIATMCGLSLREFVEMDDAKELPPTEFSEKERRLIEKFRAMPPHIRTAIEILLGIKN